MPLRRNRLGIEDVIRADTELRDAMQAASAEGPRRVATPEQIYQMRANMDALAAGLPLPFPELNTGAFDVPNITQPWPAEEIRLNPGDFVTVRDAREVRAVETQGDIRRGEPVNQPAARADEMELTIPAQAAASLSTRRRRRSARAELSRDLQGTRDESATLQATAVHYDSHGDAQWGSSAVISECGHYRYSLVRQWFDLRDGRERGPGQSIVFIMLNPSTADASKDDPTIRRCRGFAKDAGMWRMEVVNLFAYRTPKPDALFEAAAAGTDIVGPENNEAILDAIEASARVVVAWGASKNPLVNQRAGEVCLMLARVGRAVECLGTTESGGPRHPLYVKGDVRPMLFKTAAIAV